MTIIFTFSRAALSRRRGHDVELGLVEQPHDPPWSPGAKRARLSTRPIDVLLLGRLERPADACGLLRAVSGGEYPRIQPGQAVVTLGDELTVLRAYENGSDHHLVLGTGYLVLRAVLTSVVRRALEDVTTRYLQPGEVHVDLAARIVDAGRRPGRRARTERRPTREKNTQAARTSPTC